MASETADPGTTLVCPMCSGAFSIGRELQGQTAVCPHCRGNLVIPHFNLVQLPPNAIRVRTDSSADKSNRQRSRNRMRLAVTGGIATAFLFLIAGVALIAVMSTQSARTRLAISAKQTASGPRTGSAMEERAENTSQPAENLAKPLASDGEQKLEKAGASIAEESMAQSLPTADQNRRSDKMLRMLIEPSLSDLEFSIFPILFSSSSPATRDLPQNVLWKQLLVVEGGPPGYMPAGAPPQVIVTQRVEGREQFIKRQTFELNHFKKEMEFEIMQMREGEDGSFHWHYVIPLRTMPRRVCYSKAVFSERGVVFAATATATDEQWNKGWNKHLQDCVDSLELRPPK